MLLHRCDIFELMFRTVKVDTMYTIDAMSAIDTNYTMYNIFNTCQERYFF